MVCLALMHSSFPKAEWKGEKATYGKSERFGLRNIVLRHPSKSMKERDIQDMMRVALLYWQTTKMDLPSLLPEVKLFTH